MLGNFSIGDYFKQGAVEFAWEFSLEGFGFDPEQIWVTVFEGDDALGLGPDEEAIEAWLSVGVPRERIVPLGREDNFWQAGPTGPCGPCSELYLDRGLEFGSADELPGLRRRALPGVLEPRLHAVRPGARGRPDAAAGAEHRHRPRPQPARGDHAGHDVGLRDRPVPAADPRWARSSRAARTASPSRPDRALRILADHTRGMSFLVADGVVPSNEDRGYVLRRLMRRAIVQGRRIGIEAAFLPRFAGVVRELMGSAYPELHEQRETIEMWLRTEEEAFDQHARAGHAAARRA